MRREHGADVVAEHVDLVARDLRPRPSLPTTRDHRRRRGARRCRTRPGCRRPSRRRRGSRSRRRGARAWRRARSRRRRRACRTRPGSSQDSGARGAHDVGRGARRSRRRRRPARRRPPGARRSRGRAQRIDGRSRRRRRACAAISASRAASRAAQRVEPRRSRSRARSRAPASGARKRAGIAERARACGRRFLRRSSRLAVDGDERAPCGRCGGRSRAGSRTARRPGSPGRPRAAPRCGWWRSCSGCAGAEQPARHAGEVDRDAERARSRARSLGDRAGASIAWLPTTSTGRSAPRQARRGARTPTAVGAGATPHRRAGAATGAGPGEDAREVALEVPASRALLPATARGLRRLAPYHSRTIASAVEQVDRALDEHRARARRPARRANARSSVGASSRTRATRAPPTSRAARTSASWSMSCSAPRPLSTVAVAPPRMTTGDCASCAFLTAVIVLVTPGPGGDRGDAGHAGQPRDRVGGEHRVDLSKKPICSRSERRRAMVSGGRVRLGSRAGPTSTPSIFITALAAPR